MKSNIVLIGMPGAGKSTIGPMLAERLGLTFIDTDSVLKSKSGRELREIVASDGFAAFLRLQEECIRELSLTGYVVATGGAVVLSSSLMEHLKERGIIVYLKNSFRLIESRMDPSRKLARAGGKTLKETYDERAPLYEKYSDIVIECDDKTVDSIVGEIASVIQ